MVPLNQQRQSIERKSIFFIQLFKKRTFRDKRMPFLSPNEQASKVLNGDNNLSIKTKQI